MTSMRRHYDVMCLLGICPPPPLGPPNILNLGPPNILNLPTPMIINPAPSLLMKHLVTGQRQKAPNFSAFHWSPHGSLVSIGQHFVTTRVVHLPKRTETSLITESDQNGPNHQLLQLRTARTARSDSDQAVRAVHSCNS